jgi:hypothetical protein
LAQRYIDQIRVKSVGGGSFKTTLLTVAEADPQNL